MRSSGRLVLSFITALFAVYSVSCTVQSPAIDPSILTPSKSLGECQACKLFIESFKKGLKRTERANYEGGDAAWEEEKLKSYKHSELRLVDIQEHICQDERKHAVQCHSVAEKAEEFIEEWWTEDPDEKLDLFSHICINKMKLCCPTHHYGKDCAPCPGDHAKLCSGNGKCRGDGTRKGNGTCNCDPGYAGDNCDQCGEGYFLSYKDEDKMLCSKCHKSCLGCRDASQKDCLACKPGYTFDSEDGCIDVNECYNDNVCDGDHYCLNSIGSYICKHCDRSCKGCHGDGPDMCKKCAKGFSKKADFCIPDIDEGHYEEMLTAARYMTYIGLLIATGILLPKSTSLGGMVGAMVLSYIFGAEYYCMINGHTGLVNLKDYDLFQLLRT